jgi:hypothetical protein
MPQPVISPKRIVAAIGILLATSLACSIGRSATPAAGTPSVTITDPLPGQRVPVGEPLVINSTSVDKDGIQRTELWIDDTLLRVDSNPDVNSPYIVSQPWKSDVPGTHVIVVKAFDAQGVEGQSQPIIITLDPAAGAGSVYTPVAEVSPSPSSEVSPTPPLKPTKTPTPSALRSTPAPKLEAPTYTPVVTCTPPLCETDEVHHCPAACPGGCGTQCATPTPRPTPPFFEPTGVETHDIFKPIWEHQEVKDYLGYPIETARDGRHYARQYFERGYLYWWDQPDARGLIWVIEISQPGARQGFGWSGPHEDLCDGGEPYSCDTARGNPDGPIRGFGKLWCDNPEIAEAIGAARGSEQGTGNTSSYGAVQFFQAGVMLHSPLDRQVWVLLNGGTWQLHAR